MILKLHGDTLSAIVQIPIDHTCNLMAALCVGTQGRPDRPGSDCCRRASSMTTVRRASGDFGATSLAGASRRRSTSSKSGCGTIRSVLRLRPRLRDNSSSESGTVGRINVRVFESTLLCSLHKKHSIHRESISPSPSVSCVSSIPSQCLYDGIPACRCCCCQRAAVVGC